MGNSTSISKSKKTQSLKPQENFEVPQLTNHPKNKLEKSPEVTFEVPTKTETKTKPDNHFDDEEYDHEEERDQINDVIDIKKTDAKDPKIKGMPPFIKKIPK